MLRLQRSRRWPGKEVVGATPRTRGRRAQAFLEGELSGRILHGSEALLGIRRLRAGAANGVARVFEVRGELRQKSWIANDGSDGLVWLKKIDENVFYRAVHIPKLNALQSISMATSRLSCEQELLSPQCSAAGVGTSRPLVLEAFGSRNCL